jgi:thioredoxin 1
MAAAQAVACVAPAASTSGRLGGAARARAPAAALRPAPRQLALRRSAAAPARRMQTCVRAVLDVTNDSFEKEVLQSEVPVLVDFWANWCGPCKLMHPMMAWAEKEYGAALKVVKIEADANKATLEKYKVYGLPCFILFKDGQEVPDSHSEGAMSKKALQDYLAKFGIKAAVTAA